MPTQKTITPDEDTEFPRNWRFDEDGLELVGCYIKSDVGPTANGDCPILVLEVDGEPRSLCSSHRARRRIADEVARRPHRDLKAGERIVIRQGEKKPTAEGGRAYVSYFVRFLDAPPRTAKDVFKADAIDEPPTSHDSEATPEEPAAGGDDDIPSEPVDRLLDRLERVKRNGSGFIARCPAHPDREPSLSVSEGDDGRVLVKCHAGCSTEAIVQAAGLELRDLFPAQTEARRTIATTYDYVDARGELLYQAVRFQPKGFAQRRPDENGYSWRLGDVERVLYRLPRVLEAAQAGETVFVVEGEKDVEVLEALGLVATCNAMGAGKWRDEYAEALRGAGRVVVIPDDDDAGRAHAVEVARSLEGIVDDVRLVELWPNGSSGKDVSDWAATQSDAEREQAAALLAEIVERSPKFSIPPPIALEAGGNETSGGVRGDSDRVARRERSSRA